MEPKKDRLIPWLVAAFLIAPFVFRLWGGG
jgi:hypothetical protein